MPYLSSKLPGYCPKSQRTNWVDIYEGKRQGPLTSENGHFIISVIYSRGVCVLCIYVGASMFLAFLAKKHNSDVRFYDFGNLNWLLSLGF